MSSDLYAHSARGALADSGRADRLPGRMRGEPRESAQLKAAVEAAGDVAYEWDFIEDRVVWSGRVETLFAVPAGVPASGEAWTRAIFAEDLAGHTAALAAPTRGESPFDCEYRIHGRDGKLTWVHDRGAVELGADGKPARLRGVLRVISQRKQREARLEYLANFDELTGHFNRTRLKEALDHAIAYSARYRAPAAYMVVGIDRLSYINEAFGTETADAVVIGLGRLLDRCLRASDVIGRLGGDRFGIVLANCPEPDIALAAEKILQNMRQSPIQTPSGSLHVTVSVGAVPFLEQGIGSEEAFGRADSALIRAKRAGRDCYVGYCDSAEQRETRRRVVTIAEEVQGALKTDRLLLAFQPIVAADDRRIDHYECLARLKRADGTLLPAAAFVPVVEQSVLMRLVDRRALELAVHELTGDPDVRLAINISGLTAADRSWLRAMNALLKGRRDVASRLIVEITETVALQDIEETARFVAAVRGLGCRVALDDFGAGYSSFRNLKALSVDCVKIDGSFVRGLASSVDNQLFVRTLLGLAEGFGLDTVAECVETAAEAEHLVRRGVHYLQGYYFGRPSIERPWRDKAPSAAGAVALEAEE